PDFSPTKDPMGPGGDDAFIMRPYLKGQLFSPLSEGPFPEHYEPLESPVRNLLSSVQFNPAAKVWNVDADKAIGDLVGDRERFPYVATTYRIVEHWQAGAMSRWLPWLAELQPEMFVEISTELAKEKGIKNGERVVVRSARGEIQCVAVVTNRIKPMTVGGQTIHMVGMVWHFGWKGLATGPSANELTPHVGDANTMIPEYKAFLVDIRKVM
ncbi:MAG: formate dehydrogenase, partial [Anaerolineae bacterium]|nr:formate dehydrogenase [Anaerolineae bacterium]